MNDTTPAASKTLSDLSAPELEAWLTSLGQPKFRARQIQEWLWKHLATTLDEMTNLPKDLRRLLQEQSSTGALTVSEEQVSSDGTAKWAFEDGQGRRFESVMIPDEDRPALTACGYQGIFGPGSSTDDIIRWLREKLAS